MMVAQNKGKHNAGILRANNEFVNPQIQQKFRS
jgi:hypothetical protein